MAEVGNISEKDARLRRLLPIIRIVAAGNLKISSDFPVIMIGSDKENLKRWGWEKTPGGLGQ
jgi:hypothetical protein